MMIQRAAAAYHIHAFTVVGRGEVAQATGEAPTRAIPVSSAVQ